MTPSFASPIADLGVTYKHGKGLAINGNQVPAQQVGMLAIGIMRDVAPRLEVLGYQAEARALTLTANDLEESGPALGNFIRALRPLLPAPPAADIGTFLNDLAERGFIPKSDLLATYLAAGSPGNLGKNTLYAEVARIYPTTARRGVRGFNTSASRSSDSENGLDSALDDLIARYGLAAIHATLADRRKDTQ